MAKLITVAIGQTEADLGDVEANLGNVTTLLRHAAEAGADIAVFPELCFTGYHMDKLGAHVHTLSEDWQARIDETMRETTAACGIYAITGQALKRDGVWYNAARLYDRAGNVAGDYCKRFIFEKEKQFFSPGAELPVFETDFGTIGILVCYDIGFPETARALSLAGAKIIFMPSAWRAQDEHAWNLNVPSRALENQCFTVAVNHAGVFGDLRLFGRSLVCGPDGRPVLQLGYDRQMLGVCHIDLADIADARRQVAYMADIAASTLAPAGFGPAIQKTKTNKNIQKENTSSCQQ